MRVGKRLATLIAIGAIVALFVFGCTVTEVSPTQELKVKSTPAGVLASSPTPSPMPTASPTARAVLLFPTATPVPSPTPSVTPAPIVDGEYFVQIVRVLDGDTVEVEVDGVGIEELRAQTIRIEGVDTPETRTSDAFEKACGNWSKERVVEFLSEEGQYVLLTDFEDGGFGRKLGDIRSPTGQLLTDFLLGEGLAVEYDATESRDFEDHRENCEALVEEGHIAGKSVDAVPKEGDEPLATATSSDEASPIPTRSPATEIGDTVTPTPVIEATIAPGVTYKTCEEAEEAGLERVKGSKGDGRGFPVNLMDGPRDGDGDGVVCEE